MWSTFERVDHRLVDGAVSYLDRRRACYRRVRVPNNGQTFFIRFVQAAQKNNVRDASFARIRLVASAAVLIISQMGKWANALGQTLRAFISSADLSFSLSRPSDTFPSQTFQTGRQSGCLYSIVAGQLIEQRTVPVHGLSPS